MHTSLLGCYVVSTGKQLTALWKSAVPPSSGQGNAYMNNTYLHIYSLTPLSRVLLEKLTDFQLVKKFPAFYGTRRFITAVTSARHLFPS